MKIREAALDAFILLIFLAGFFFAYFKFKSAYDYALVKNLQFTPLISSSRYENESLFQTEAAFESLPQGPPAQPQLISPQDGAFFYNGPGNLGVYFHWQEMEYAASYTIRISTRADLRAPIFKEIVKTNSFVLTGKRALMLPETVFYWSVMQTDLEGETSSYSPPRTFSVGLLNK
ncbi:MAG: hypothetical protein LBC53_01700 [Spirochaetaceae bacterium]|jgi:hypothetical protein|nr:hypothetical protein [Spirochaetaceae bacterium]